METNEDLIEMCRQDGVQLRRTGQRYYGKCPFHHDTKPSFEIKLNKYGYWTFRCRSTFCNVWGGATRYRELTERPPIARKERPSEPKANRYDPVKPEIVALASQHYAEMLPENQEALRYLEDRGIDKAKAIEWGLGYAPNDTLHRLLSKQMTEQELERCPLLRHYRKDDRFVRRIVISTRLPDGSAGWCTARAIDPDRDPKYLHMQGKRPALMEIATIKGPHKIYPIITEGPFDALAVMTAGYPVQCTNGNPYEHRLAEEIKEQGMKRVFILPDRDDGGAGWAASVGRATVAAGAMPVLLELPEWADDPADMLSQHAPEPSKTVATAVRIGQVRYPKGWKPPEREDNFHYPHKEHNEMANMRGDPINFFGHMTRDPESQTTKTGSDMVKFAVAANHSIWDSTEEKYVDKAIFYDCTAFGPVAKQINENLGKGDYGWFRGPVQFREYSRRDGSPGYSHDVTVEDAHVNIGLVKRDKKKDDQDSDRDNRGRDRDRERDNSDSDDRGRDRKPEHERPRAASRDDRDDRDDRSRDRDDRDTRDTRENSGRRDDDRGATRRDDRDNSGRRDDRDSRDDPRGDWTPPPETETDDLPF